MKKLLFLACALLLMFAFNANAQVRVIPVDPNLKIEVKRCVLIGTSVYIDMLFTNMSSKDSSIDLRAANAYDDEGNTYDYKVTSYKVGSGGETGTLPCEIGIKIRLTIKDVSKYATIFKKIVINSYDPYSTIKIDGTQILNVPISKE